MSALDYALKGWALNHSQVAELAAMVLDLAHDLALAHELIRKRQAREPWPVFPPSWERARAIDLAHGLALDEDWARGGLAPERPA